MAFFEVQFPTDVSFLARGGPSFSTNVNKGLSGAQQRNRNWSLGLGKWKIDLHYKPYTYFQSVYNLWLNVGGGADGFRFKDHKDFQAFGQALGVGDGNTTVFQLQKTYAIGGRSYVKPILKPVTSQVMRFDGTYCPDTVVCYLDGVAKTIGVDYTVDWTTGLVTFTTAPHGATLSPVAPGAVITADFQFDYAVRFVSDEFTAQVEESDVAGGNLDFSWPSIDLEELRDVPPGPWGVAGPPPSIPSTPPIPTPAGQQYMWLYPTVASPPSVTSIGIAIATTGPGDFASVLVFEAGGLVALEQPTATLANFELPAGFDPTRIQAIYGALAYSAIPDQNQPGIWSVNLGPISAGGSSPQAGLLFELLAGSTAAPTYNLAALGAAAHIANSVWPASVQDQLGMSVAVLVFYI